MANPINKSEKRKLTLTGGYVGADMELGPSTVLVKIWVKHGKNYPVLEIDGLEALEEVYTLLAEALKEAKK